MLINLDKIFVNELKKNGYEIDYKTMVEIYRASRNSPACIARKRRNAIINNAMYINSSNNKE